MASERLRRQLRALARAIELSFFLLAASSLQGCAFKLFGSAGLSAENSASSSLSYSTCAYLATLPVGSAASITPTSVEGPGPFSVSPALPSGLSLDPMTGVISGTPTASGGPTQYTVSSGSFATTINLQTVSGYVVNDLGDATDETPGDGICATSTGTCTLRAAIVESNADGAGTRNIIFNVQGTVSVGSTLTISKNLNIYGSCPGNAIVDGGGTQQIFEDTADNINISMQSLRIQNGTATGGGGAFSFDYSTNVSLTGNYLYFYNNIATGGAGAIDNEETSDSLSLTNSVFDSNQATSAATLGGAILSGGTLTVKQCLFTNNQANGYGGALSLDSSPNSIQNSTFYENSATTEGGAIYFNYAATLYNNSFVANSSSGMAALAGSAGVVVTAANNLIYDNTGTSQCGEITVSSEGGNLGYPSFGSCTFGLSTDINTEPSLGALQDNGGFSETLALLTGSAGIGAAVTTYCPGVDQRGYPRLTEGVCDIGAYETQP